MFARRLAAAGLLLTAATGLSACGPAVAGDAPAPSRPPRPADPAAELAAAAAALDKERTVAFAIDSPGALTARGVTERTGDRSEVTMTVGGGPQRVQLTVRSLGHDMWVRYGGDADPGGRPGTWYHGDRRRMPGGGITLGTTPTATELVRATTGIRRDGERTYRGMVDTAKAPNADPAARRRLAARAAAIPLTARVDPQGRIVELVLDMSTVQPGAGDMRVTYADFGAPVTVQRPPAAKTVEMPPEMARAFGD